IISTVMVVSVSVLIKSIEKVKQNELEETANLLMIQALEISKSPSDVFVSDSEIINLPVNSTRYYRYAVVNNQNILQKQGETTHLSDCSSGSNYNIQRFEEEFENLSLCMQIAITPVNLN